MYFKNNQMLEFCCCSLGLGFRVFKSCGSEDTESFAANNESCFPFPKIGEEESK